MLSHASLPTASQAGLNVLLLGYGHPLHVKGVWFYTNTVLRARRYLALIWCGQSSLWGVYFLYTKDFHIALSVIPIGPISGIAHLTLSPGWLNFPPHAPRARAPLPAL